MALNDLHNLTKAKMISGRLGGLMVSVLISESSSLGSSSDQGHCVMFLGKALNCHSASLHPGF